MKSQDAASDADFIEQQRLRLESLRKELLGGEERALASQRAFHLQHGGEAEEVEERAQEMAQNEINQALHDVDDQRLSHIDRALQKIQDGTYGLSDASGEPIPRARLVAMPEANLTVEEEDERRRKSRR